MYFKNTQRQIFGKRMVYLLIAFKVASFTGQFFLTVKLPNGALLTWTTI